jgi:hypothetical protein
MPNWKKVILSGSDAVLNDITSSGDISSSGDIYANNFYGNFEGTIDSASHAVNVRIDGLTPSLNVPVILGFTNQLYESANYPFTFNPGTGNLIARSLTGTASYATFAETIDIVNTPTNASVHSVLFALNDSVKTDSTAFTYQPSTDKLSVSKIDATDVTGSNFVGETIRIRHQNGYDFLDVGSLVGGGYLIAGDPNSNDNGTVFKVNDEDREITLKFDESATHLFSPTGLTITGSITTTGSIEATNNISASGNLYGSNLIFPDTNSKITTPSGLVTDDYLQIVSNGSNQHFTVVLDGSDFFKVDFTNELITLNESTQIGAVSSDTHTFTGNITASNNISASGNVYATAFHGDGSNLDGLPAGYTDSDNTNHLNSLNVVSGSQSEVLTFLDLTSSSDVRYNVVSASAIFLTSSNANGQDFTISNTNPYTVDFSVNTNQPFGNFSTFRFDGSKMVLEGDHDEDSLHYFQFESDGFVNTNKSVGEIRFDGYSTGEHARIITRATEDHSSTRNGTRLIFQVHPKGNSGLVSAFRLDADEGAKFNINVTASGDISASGDITAGNIIASGTISSSDAGDNKFGGRIVLDNDVPVAVRSGGSILPILTVSNTNITEIGNSAVTSEVRGAKIKLSANVTASGDISASGDVIADNLIGNVSAPSITLNTNQESSPLDHAIIYPQSGNMSVADALTQTKTIGKNLKFGETERGTIIISSSFGGTDVTPGFDTYTPALNVYVPFFKVPIKNSQVAFDWNISAINDDDEIFATAKLSTRGGVGGRGHIEWYSGSLIATNNVDFNTIEGPNDNVWDNFDNTFPVASTIFSPDTTTDGVALYDIGDNTSAGNYYLFNHKVDLIQDPILHRSGYSHTSNWNSNHYSAWGTDNLNHVFDVDNILRRFRWGGPYTADGEDHLYFRWENNASLEASGDFEGWRDVRFIIHINYEVSNYRF